MARLFVALLCLYVSGDAIRVTTRLDQNVQHDEEHGQPFVGSVCKWEEDLHTFLKFKHPCNTHPHIHQGKCRYYNYAWECEPNKDAEALGCHLMNYAKNKTWEQDGMRDQAHWNLANIKTRLVSPHSIDVTRNYGYGDECKPFLVPDYCSRAMLSSLSTVYNGRDRYSDTLAGIKVLFRTWNPVCKRDYKDRAKAASRMKQVFTEKRTSKACWNLVNDWRHLYCSDYGQCACEDTSDEGCHLNPEKIKCCKDRFQEFINSEYNIHNVSEVMWSRPVQTLWRSDVYNADTY